ncbi:MAG: hypothetical protein R8M38_04000 [Mariprofundaceae bacterium]
MDNETANLTTFFQRCNSSHREFYSGLISRWDESGLPRSWHAQGVALQTRFAGEHVDIFFLQAGSIVGANKIIIELSAAQRISDHEQTLQLARNIKDIHGLTWQGNLEVIEPGEMAGELQQQLRCLMVAFALH